jgi:dCMP deaminase
MVYIVPLQYTTEEIKNKYNVTDEYVVENFKTYTKDEVDKHFKEMKWFKFYLKIANMYSDLSKDPRTKVGAIIVSSDFGKILSVGYNGWAKGEPDIPDSLDVGGHGTVHAEFNCMIKLDNKNQYPNSYMFININPCRVCARGIVNLGMINTLVYEKEYRDTSGLEILTKANIKVKKINLI